jgi:hypothetical protein
VLNREQCYPDRAFVWARLKDPPEQWTFASRVSRSSFDLRELLMDGPWPLRLFFVCLAFAYVIFVPLYFLDLLPLY